MGHAGFADTTQIAGPTAVSPATNKILNLAYRFRRDSLEQGDVSWSWPMTLGSWNFVGRYNYSFRDEEALEEFLRPRIRELLLGPEARLTTAYLRPRRNSRFVNRSCN